jgi:phosphoribosyl-ATP pyrophosphohydrolase
MAKTVKKPAAPVEAKKPGGKKAAPKKTAAKKLAAAKPKKHAAAPPPLAPPMTVGASAAVLERLWTVIEGRRDADPALSHSARLLSRGTAKVAQKFGEEAVECVIEAVGGNRAALVAESADVLYHLIVMWVNAGIRPAEVWAELQRREGVSGVAEKASRARALPLELGVGTTKIP